MHAFEYLRNPGKVGPRPIVAIVGDDLYLRRECLAAVARQALGDGADDLAVSRFAGESASLADVLDEARTLPFLSKARVVVVENADPFITAHRKELEAFAERPAGPNVLVLVAKSLPSNTRLAKLIDKSGLLLDGKAPAERDLPAWLVELARARHGLKLDAEASRLLVELVGPEVGLLAAELDKLAVYVGTHKGIHRDDVATMVGAGRVESLWNILDAATLGQGGKALAELDKLLDAGEPPVKLLAGVAASLRKVYHAGQLRLRRVPDREACARAGIPPFAVEKTLRQHAHLGRDRVSRLPELLLRADLDLKGSSQLPPRTVLERLLLDLARPRHDGRS
jgi:DNA polymerase-3 subunit delta